MECFTPKSKISEIRNCKEFAPFKKYVVCPRQFAAVMGPLTLEKLTQYYPFDVPVLCDALNEMRLRRQRGEQLFYDLGDAVGLCAFLIGKKAPLVLILPGGGYVDVCSFVEGFSTATRFNELGFNAVIGQYHVGKRAHYPAPQQDVSAILSFVFDHADEWQVDIKNYAVCGFSAGGHVAGCWGVRKFGYEKYSLPKPAAVILCYPVLTMGEKTHPGSRALFLGREAKDQALQREWSLEERVDAGYPPTFLWQCTHDDTVPFENSLMMKEALERAGVPLEFMPVEGTKHGWGVAKNTPAEGWTQRAADFYHTVCKGEKA